MLSCAKRRRRGDPDVSLRRHGRRHRRSFSRCDRADSIGRRCCRNGIAELFRKQGKLIGQQLRALGFNTDFAPCIDLRFEESKSALGSRTVSAIRGDNSLCARVPRRTSRCRNPRLRQALSRARRCHTRQPSRSAVDRQDVETTLERRPGSLSRDAHRISVRHGGARFVSQDFRRHTPASLSKKWITEILRKKIGYRGIGCLRRPRHGWRAEFRVRSKKRRLKPCVLDRTYSSSVRRKSMSGGPMRLSSSAPNAISRSPNWLR